MHGSLASARFSLSWFKAYFNSQKMPFELWFSCRFIVSCLLAGLKSGNSHFHSPYAGSLQCLTALAIVCAVAAVAYGFVVYGYLPWAHTLIGTHHNDLKGRQWTTGMYVSCILYVVTIGLFISAICWGWIFTLQRGLGIFGFWNPTLCPYLILNKYAARKNNILYIKRMSWNTPKAAQLVL